VVTDAGAPIEPAVVTALTSRPESVRLRQLS